MTSETAAGDDPRAHPHFGRTIARCKIAERIGEGRTSHVFKAFYEPLEKHIAVKILTGEMAGFQEIRESFLGEARAIAKLDHEHIVKVLDVTEDQGCMCILMEFVAGRTLHELLREKGALPPKKALRIAAQMARALEHAHADGIVHRDIKPANVILAGPGEQVKMVDFGLAGRKHVANRAGTPMYMSPEAAQGKRIDEKSDVYGLGVCLYQMLTGKLPFGGKSVKEILAAHVNVEAAPPSVALPGLGTDYDALMKKLLVKAKGYRPTAAEAAELISPFLDEEADDQKGGRKGRGRPGRVRAAVEAEKSKAPMIVGIVAVVALGIVGAVLLFGKKDPPPPPTPPVVPTTGSGGAAKPVTPPVPEPPKESPQEKAAREAYDKAAQFAKDSAEDLAGQATQWGKVATEHAGTSWADKAANKERDVRDALDAQEKLKESERRSELNQKTVQERAWITEAVAVFDFARAWEIAASHRNLDEEPVVKWRKRSQRIRFLSEEFVRRADQGLEDYGQAFKANRVVKTMPEVRDLVGVTEKGLEWSDGSLTGTILWTELKGQEKTVYHDFFRKLIQERNPADNLFMAILAAELWPDEGESTRWSKNYREMVGLVDNDGTVTREMADYFE